MAEITIKDGYKITCKRDHSKSSGCGRCGGYKHVLMKHSCSVCGAEYWSQGQSGYTIYEGKPWDSFDGRMMRESMTFGTVCETCYVEPDTHINGENL